MRLIDADALADELAVLMERNSQLIDEWMTYQVEDAIENAPTVDAEIVVRCGDCCHMQVDTLFHKHWCNGREVELYDYCSKGERRKG